MSEYDFDLIVIGGGSGGVRTARWSGGLGAKVAIVENDRMGGTCVIRGCIPKKLMVMASHFKHEAEVMKSYGFETSEIVFNLKQLNQNRDAEIERLSGLYASMLAKNNVTILQGLGSLLSNHEVVVEGKTYSAKNIVVATGGKPFVPQFEGREHVLTSDGMFSLKQMPQSFGVVGGGYIGLEFASIMNGLGAKTTIIMRNDLPLRGFDEDCRKYLKERMEKNGIDFINSNTGAVEVDQEKKKGLKLSNGVLAVDEILYATGRRPNTKNIGLEKVGVELNEKGAIVTDDSFKTSVDSIYAIGDCTDRVNLTPVATAEGTLLAERLFNNGNGTMSYDLIPSAVFSTPELATVGLNEEQARAKYGEVDVYTSEFRALKYTLSKTEDRTFMKLITLPNKGKVVGCHMVGDYAAEGMQGVAIALKCGATKKQFDETIGIHPSSNEEWTTMRNLRGS